MCKWKPKYPPDYECKEPPLPDDPDGYCILHSENEAKDIKAFKEKVEERITKGKLTSSGHETDKIDLRGCYFPRDFDKGYFSGYQFNKPVDFSEATFTGGASFSKATFTKGANFREATFTEWANFIGATFTKRADFIWATFTEGANFRVAKFTEGANFSEAKFTKGTFIGTAFEGGACFDYAEFSERVSLQPRVTWKGKVKKLLVLLGPGSSFQYTRFLGEAMFQDVDLSNCSFLHSNIDEVDFRHCEFAKKPVRFLWFNLEPRKNVLRDELEADEDVGAGLKPAPTVDEPDGDEDEDVEKNLSETGTRFFASLRMTKDEEKLREERYEPVRRLYLELKRNFEDKKDWNTAGDFHYGEMECRRKKMGWLGRNIFSLEAVYYWASGYGERPLRALSWWFFSTLLFFPLLYRLSEHDPFSTCVWDSVRVATFMKIGIPIEPESWGRIVLTLQYFICPTLLALFALALRRKVKR